MTDTNLERRPVPEDAPMYASTAEEYVERMRASSQRVFIEELTRKRDAAMASVIELLCDSEDLPYEQLLELIAVAKLVSHVGNLILIAERGELRDDCFRTDEGLREDFERMRRRQEASDA